MLKGTFVLEDGTIDTNSPSQIERQRLAQALFEALWLSLPGSWPHEQKACYHLSGGEGLTIFLAHASPHTWQLHFQLETCQGLWLPSQCTLNMYLDVKLAEVKQSYLPNREKQQYITERNKMGNLLLSWLYRIETLKDAEKE